MVEVLTAREIEALRTTGKITETEARAIRQVLGSRIFDPYQYAPDRYIIENLGWEPWGGSEEQPGQQEILAAYTLALRQMHERDDYEAGILSGSDLQYWQPGQIIKNRIRVEAGHTVGKTKLSSGIVNHFFDCFQPSIIYTFAPNWKQIHDLLWKEIKVDRRGKGLPGRILDLQLLVGDNHFANGTATNDAGGKGTERIHGQHNKYLMFVLDEAEGIPDFVFSAVDSMASGGICIVLQLANPRTRTSKFHKAKDRSDTKSYRLSCVWHPNVLAGREIIPGAVRRDYVREMVESHCEIVTEDDDDNYTFTLPFEIQTSEHVYQAGTIFKPNSEFLFRVLGIAPANVADNTIVPVGRYEAACKRERPIGDITRARMGVDVSRYGKDFGTLYLSYAGTVSRRHQFWQQDTNDYAHKIKAEALALPRVVTSLHIRIDGGGGFGGGVIDKLKIDDDLKRRFDDFQVLEVNFGGSPHDDKAYYDLVTEMYAQAAETLKGIRINNAPESLEADLCERLYGWRNVAGVDVKKLESKDDFRKPNRRGRSPDDGDGFVLAVAPDFLFVTERQWYVV